MFCNKCGNILEPNQQYCNKCGNRVVYNFQNERINNNEYNGQINNTRRNRNIVIPVVLITVVICIIIGIILYFVGLNNKKSYYFNEEIGYDDDDEIIDKSSNRKNHKNKTDIITDNVYTGISSNISESEAKELLEEDSESQKNAPDYPQEIIDIEEDIIDKYSIPAVNLKEMDEDFAKEIENVFEKIYKEYPTTKINLTNLTLTNLDLSQSGVIALFRPYFPFALVSKYQFPWVVKTQLQLSARYFLNSDVIEKTVEECSKSGHFPPNATRTSAVSHELGHYLSFIALLKHHNVDSVFMINDNKDFDKVYEIMNDCAENNFSKQMLDEAYKNYLDDGNEDIGFDEWRGEISGYALAKDENGDYIYDESIAESFHDVYLNGDNASTPSKYIIKVLKKYLER